MYKGDGGGGVGVGGEQVTHSKDLSPTVSFPLSVGRCKKLASHLLFAQLVRLSSHRSPGVPLLATPDC